MRSSGELTGVPDRLQGPRRRHGRPPARRARDHRGAPEHGEDRARAEHRAQRRGRPPQEGGGLLARDDQALARAAPARVRGARRPHELPQGLRQRRGLQEDPARGEPALRRDDLDGRHRHDHDPRDQGASAGACTSEHGPRPRDARLPPARARQHAHAAQGPRDRRDQPRPQVAGEGARHPGGRALAAEPRPRAARPRQAPAQHGRPARVGRDRAGRRPDRVHLPRRGLQPEGREPRARRADHRQAAQRADRHRQAPLRRQVRALRDLTAEQPQRARHVRAPRLQRRAAPARRAASTPARRRLRRRRLPSA